MAGNRGNNDPRNEVSALVNRDKGKWPAGSTEPTQPMRPDGPSQAAGPTESALPLVAGEVEAAFSEFLLKANLRSILTVLGRTGDDPVMVAAFASGTRNSKSESRKSAKVILPTLILPQAAPPVAQPSGTLASGAKHFPGSETALRLDGFYDGACRTARFPGRFGKTWREISFDGGGWGKCSVFVPGQVSRPGTGVLLTGAAILGRDVTTGRARSDLRERVKELTCLYGISQVALVPGTGVDEILSTVVSLLPPAWCRPEKAMGRISFDGRQWFSGAGYRDEFDVIRAPIVIEGRIRGFVEVGYPDSSGDSGWVLLDPGEGWAGILQAASPKSFLPEEKQLISTVGSQLSIILERILAEAERIRLEEQVRHADRLATVGQLAAGVAHELNEPLTNILGFVQFIQEDRGLSEQSGRDVERIVKAALHAREIVRKLVLFSRQKPPRKGIVNLNDIISEGLFFLNTRCQAKGIVLEMDLDPGLPGVEADAGQIHQVLVNLVVNSIQAIAGKGRIVVGTRRGPSGEAIFEVSDDGHGMIPEVRDKVFIPFFTTKDIDQGTGLGLSVVHGIVTSHGGTVEVVSDPGAGATFTVTLSGVGEKGSSDEIGRPCDSGPGREGES